MGQFANSLFSMLLGWVQAAASWLWGLFADPDGGGFLRWVLDHWLALVLLLCIAGVAVDFVVYLFRWQPYRVWGRFLRRLTAKEEPDAQGEERSPVFQRKWLYADGSTSVEDVHEEPQVQTAFHEALDAPIRPNRRVARRASGEKAYNQPVYPPQWQHDQQGENE